MYQKEMKGGRRFKTVGLIPARKGSKRVQNKTLTILGNKPLIDYTFEAALKSNLTEIYFTTDYGEEVKVPKGITKITRPPYLCTDTATASGYIAHFFERVPDADIVVLLQPTCPLRTFNDINRALKQYYGSKKHTLVSAYKIPSRNYLYIEKNKWDEKEIVSAYGENVIDGKVAYCRNSAIYIFTRQHFLTYNSIFAIKPEVYIMPKERSIDIDYQIDMYYAARMLKQDINIDGGVDIEYTSSSITDY